MAFAAANVLQFHLRDKLINNPRQSNRCWLTRDLPIARRFPSGNAVHPAAAQLAVFA
jgi:hypothetical protein